MSKNYPVGIQNFEEIRKGGYFYIDKTAKIFQMVNTGKYYFLSRPRRFGKSLLISTLETYFSGKKELFQGLDLANLEKEWIAYPVLHLDLNAKNYENESSLLAILNQHLEGWENVYGNEKCDRDPEERLAYLIEKISRTTGRNVVFLVDEYDKPMLQTIGNETLQEYYRNQLKAFYSVLKSCDRYIRFALLTGVTKFSKISIFSDLNNLEDISMQPAYNAICGITEDELKAQLTDEIKELGKLHGMDDVTTLNRLKTMYDGYHFSKNKEGLYNPFSLLNVMKSKEFGSYWFETGTPSFLVELLKCNHYNLQRLTHELAMSDSLNGIDNMDPIPLLYQSGYLTIKDYDNRFNTYTLGFPNREVEEGFIRFIMPYYTGLHKSDSAFEIVHFVTEVEKGDVDGFMRRLQSFFEDTPYELVRDLELHYQNVLFIIFKLLGFYTQAEYHTSEGRIDLTVKTNHYIYVMEFKLEGSAEEALQQINDKHYALPFKIESKKIIKIGVNFSNQSRNIEKWMVDYSSC